MKKAKLSEDYVNSDTDTDSVHEVVVVKDEGKTAKAGAAAEEMVERKAATAANVNGKTSTPDPSADSRTFELSSKRRVTVRRFKSSILVDIREFYEDRATGEELPGKKGISLTLEQFTRLKDLIPSIEAAIEEL